MVESGDVAVGRWQADRAKLGFSRKENRAAATIRAMLGRQFGRLTVVAYDSLKLRPDGVGAKVWWLCQCECGNCRPIKAENLLITRAPTQSCGECAVETPQWSDFVLRQIALAVEWEGSVGVYETESTSFTHGAYHSPRITVSVRASTDVLLHRMHELAQVGSVTLANNSQAAAGLRAEMAQWQTTGPVASKLAAALEPFFITKYEQAQLVAAYQHGARHKAVPREVFEERRAAACRTGELNATGPSSPPVEADGRAERWASGVTEAERAALLALTIDFEGCISVRLRGHYRSTSISVPQARRRVALLSVVQNLAACGHLVHGLPDPEGRLDAVSSWAVHSAGEVTQLAHDITPYLLVKRGQAEAVCALFGSTAPTELVALVKRLNAKHEKAV